MFISVFLSHLPFSTACVCILQTKPAKTKTLIDAGKEIFQEWLAEEVMSFSEETNVLLVEMMLKITDKVRKFYLRDLEG